jgi:hypothetical protein
MSALSTRGTRTSIGLALGTLSIALSFPACFEPPPRIESIPPSGLALRLHVFGASAKDASDAFQALKQTNKGFALVREGGDGEVLVGLENDSPKCVAPTALCSFKVALRIKNNAGKVVHTSVTQVSANAERCADLCEKALNNLVVKVVDAAVAALKGGSADATDGGAADAEAPLAAVAEAVDAGEPVDAAPPVTKAASKKPPGKDAKDGKDRAAKDSPLCSIARGPQLKADEAERRAAQVEVLHRIDVLSQDEYDCLRKAYLDRL